MREERFGPYELQSLLGRGGMGEVFCAVDTRKNRGLVALKRLPVGLAADTDFQRRFLREAELAARLRDPHVIPIHDYGEIDGQPYLDMRLVDGVDLATLLDCHGPLPPTRAVDILAQVAGALDAAHREGLVHRDVKPQNMLLNQPEAGDERQGHETPPDFVYLIDFGIAANMLSSRLSASVVSGTAAYMAPERFTAGGDHRVDIYALGCVLYQLLTGATPFAGDFMQLMYAHSTTAPPLPSEARAGIPPDLDTVVTKAMAKDPGHRHASAGSFAIAARRALADAPTTATNSQRHRTTAPAVVAGGPVGNVRKSSIPTDLAPPPVPASDAATQVPPGPASAGDSHRRRRGVIVALLAAAALVAGILVAIAFTGGAGSGSGGAGSTTLAGRPSDVVVTPDARVYVSHRTGDRRTDAISIIDPARDAVTASIPVPGSASRLALTPDGRRIYVTGTNAISVVDVDRRVVTVTIPLSGSAIDVAVSPDGRRVYALTSARGGSIVVIDTGSTTVVGSIPSGSVSAGNLELSPDGRRAFITSGGQAGSVSLLDLVTGTVSSSISLPSAKGLAVSPDGRRVFVGTAGLNGSISVVDARSESVTSVPLAGPGEIMVSPDGTRVVVAQTTQNALAVLDAATGTPLASVPTPFFCSTFAISTDGRRAFIIGPGQDTVSSVGIG